MSLTKVDFGRRAVLTLALLTTTTGCHSAFVDATVVNHTGRVVRLLEVDYPTASFGTQDLAPEKSFHYRFKLLGNGAAKVTWTDASQKDHTVIGPILSEGQEGSLLVTLQPNTAEWQTALRP